MEYLRDLTTLDNIKKKYDEIPKTSVWSSDAYDAYGIPYPKAQPGQDSARFGKGAYNRPIEEWLRVDSFGKSNPYNSALNIVPLSGNLGYQAMYTRTKRDLGEVPTGNYTYTTPTGNSYTSPDLISPLNADFYIDIANELSRIDPNVYEFDLSGAITAPMVNSNPGLYGKNNPYIVLPEATPTTAVTAPKLKGGV